jgi:hypothetical protein
MDRAFKNEVLSVVRCAVVKLLSDRRDELEEVWLTKEEFLKQFGMFTEDWLKRYGETIPRSQAVVMGVDGEAHTTRWAYPRNRIQRMIADGSIKQLRITNNKL